MKFKSQKICHYIFLLTVIIYSLFPFYWALNTSLQSGSDLHQITFFPFSIDFTNYKKIFFEQPFGRNIINSISVATITVVMSTILSLFAAYVLARETFRGKTLILMSVLMISTFPQIAILSGLFELITFMKLYDQPIGLSFTYLIFTLPFSIWVLTAFMKEIPHELEEAAIIDGANSWQRLTQVFIPMIFPAIATVSLLSFVAAWNEFLFALTFTITDHSRTVPAAISMISGASQYESPWGPIMAASVVVTLPLITLGLLCQKYIVSGLSAGALKG